MRLQWRRELGGNSKSLPYLVFLLSISATVCAWVWAGLIVTGTDQERFNYATEEVQQAIQGRVDDQVDLLRAIAATFTLQRAWPHPQFRHFVDHLDLGTNYKGLLDLGFVKAIQPDQVASLEKLVQSEGLSPFRVHPIRNEKTLFPIVYLEPDTAVGTDSLGFDVGTDETLRQAMDYARDNGTPAVSALKTFARSTGSSNTQKGFLLFYPVYSGGEIPVRSEDRVKLLVGYVFCLLKGSGLYQNVLEGEARRYLDVQIFDMPNPNMARRIYSSMKSRYPRNSTMTLDTVFPIFGRQWLLRFDTSSVFEQESASWLVRWILMAGTLVSLLLSMVSYTQVSANRLLSDKTAELEKREAQVRQLNENLEHLVHDRTTELRASNMELEAFCYSVSHDLRAPLRSVDGFSKSLLEDYGSQLDDQATDYINRVRNASRRMDELISALLNLSRITRLEIIRQSIDISELASEAAEDALHGYEKSRFSIEVESGMQADGDPKLVRVIFDNLIGNAIKFSNVVSSPSIVVGCQKGVFFVKDNGVGFNPAYAEKLFLAFERLHSQNEFPGSGIGLATVQRIVQRHGGSIWAESEPAKGATFYFTLT